MTSAHTPRRIVSLQPSATVILESLGALDRLVACTRYCFDVCPQLAERSPTVVSDSWTAQTTQIIAAQPDLVIAAVPYQEQAVIEILKAGARFLGLAPKTLQDVYTDIAIIAGVVGNSAAGDAVIARIQSEIEAVRAAVTHAPRPRVFCEEWGNPLIASQEWVRELVEAAGGEFIGQPGERTTADHALKQDPEVWIAAWCGAGDRVPLERIASQRGWQQMRAVRDGRAYCVRDELLNTPAPTLVAGLKALASAIHPDRFPQAAGLRCIAREE